MEEYEFVDLGLPSGTLWANHNVGAKTPEEAGLYFQWADTQGYTPEQVSNGEKVFADDFSDYKYSGGEYCFDTPNFTKYCNNPSYGKDGFTDDKLALESCDDMASRGNSSVKWYVPSKDDFIELLTECTSTLLYQDDRGSTREGIADDDFDIINDGFMTWKYPDLNKTNNRIVGIKFTSKTNSNSIFLPGSGFAIRGSVDTGRTGHYWSSSLSENCCYDGQSLNFDLYVINIISGGNRYQGFSVRPVLKQNK